MYSFKSTVILGALITAATLAAQQPSSPQNQPSDTSLTATPTPKAAPVQPGARHASDPNKQTRRLAKELKLSRDQVVQIRPILAGRDQQIQQLRADPSIAPRDRRAKLQGLQQDSTAKIEALLTDTQKQQFEQLLAERRNRNRPKKD